MLTAKHDFGPKHEDTGYSGRKDWINLRRAADLIGCDHCKEKAQKILNGTELAIALHTGKAEQPLRNVKDLKYVFDYMVYAIDKLPKQGLRCHNCE
jgi:hypothetical protein